MSLLDDLMTGGAADLLLENLAAGTAITYTPAGASPVALSAIVGSITSEPDEAFEGGRARRRHCTVTFSIDSTSAYGGVASPGERDTAVIGGETWAFDKLISKTAALATVQLVIGGVVEATRRDFRRPR